MVSLQGYAVLWGNVGHEVIICLGECCAMKGSDDLFLGECCHFSQSDDTFYH